MNRTDRLVAMLLLLQSKRIVRAEDIAGHFEISLRTVYRDMRALDEAGVPVAAEAGVGYSLVKGYHLPPVMFTKEEASALFIGGELAKQFTDETVRKPIESALLKVRSVLPDEARDHIETLSEATVIVPSRSALDGARGNHTVAIQEAIASRRMVQIEYYSYSADELTRRTVEPLGMIYYGEHWHLIAHCRLREDFRDFRTDRIQSLTLKDATFPKRKNFSLKDFLHEHTVLENPIEVQVWFDRRIARYATERAYYGFVSEVRQSDGVVMTFLVRTLEPMSKWLLLFGTSVRIVLPQPLCEMMRTEAESLLNHYR